ncbi:ead/Ea22-like family protein [Enterobacter bugandensis]|uniref:ead/Ea22-like family protein n=1 Tax=Enterobacter bugandensis TaxID=881260 RepID=UPI002FD5131D
MSNIDKSALRKAAMHAKTTDDWGCDADNFHDKATPDAVLALLDELEAKEEQRANWFQLAQKLGDDLDAAEKQISELENDEVRQQLANAEHQLHMAELAKRNLRASRKAQFRKRKAAELRIAELEAREVKLPERYEIEMQPLPAPNGEWYSRDDVLSSLASAGIRICRGE